ncbi:hypothetical protein OM076_29470 [Solirubrobacter ginsenosidimutans]|uniref:Uncharacterized protein n=1 Tax=Solirubrobacter ginsenosidimutans TaxID=490573 RepID=A0A9X3MWT6_9ACTN|nr:hypothetical protein [Solirubrobacter ginsenosidimutans]MDA0164436.1 hypothetical protein [Solirubrobacter ginsenosidimutans]
MASDLEDLVGHLHRTAGLDPGTARRVVEEVLAWHREDLETFVRRRHRELQGEGVANPEAFERLAGELRRRRVLPPELSVRQIRRVIYG